MMCNRGIPTNRGRCDVCDNALPTSYCTENVCISCCEKGLCQKEETCIIKQAQKLWIEP